MKHKKIGVNAIKEIGGARFSKRFRQKGLSPILFILSNYLIKVNLSR